jgi:aconitase B
MRKFSTATSMTSDFAGVLRGMYVVSKATATSQRPLLVGRSLTNKQRRALTLKEQEQLYQREIMTAEAL